MIVFCAKFYLEYRSSEEYDGITSAKLLKKHDSETYK